MIYHFDPNPRAVPLIDTAHRQIHTLLPALGTVQVLDQLSKVEAQSMHGGLPIVWKDAFDYQVSDLADNEFIDFTSGIFAANVGHGNNEVSDAIRLQAENSHLHSYAFPTPIRAEYLDALTKWSGFEKAFLLSSGSEATEHALRLMKLHGRRTGKRMILCFDGGYHGRTLGAALLSGRGATWTACDDVDIFHLPIPSWYEVSTHSFAEALGKYSIRSETVAGVMIESYVGWKAQFYSSGFVQDIEQFCQAHGALLCFDELQSGFGRTGRKWGFQHYEVTPDLICVGKAMGNGVPISGVLGRADVLDLPEKGSIISTYSANPLSCAAGLAVIKELEDRHLVEEAERKSYVWFPPLAELADRHRMPMPFVLGKGLVAALYFQSAEFASRVAERCMEKGLLVVHTGRETVKLGPPLTTPDDALLEGVAVIGEAVAEIEKEGQ